LHIEKSGVKVCNLILRPLFGRVWLADLLEEAIGWLGAEQATRWEVNTELEALQSPAVRVQDLVLERDDMTSSLAASVPSVAKLLENRIDTAAANWVH
jgi:hypothetical protein